MRDTSPPDDRPANHAAHFGRGFLMGAADIVPGVSGGTVALVLGIYNRLLTAIASFDGRLLVMLTERRWADAAARVDLRFLATLGAGILCGVFSLARLMSFLLEQHRELTYAAFFGMILASGVLVGRMCRPPTRAASARCLALGLAGAVAAFVLVSQDALENRPGLPYTFACGGVAICAMILPGISGSYLLVILDKYEEITGIIKDLPHGDVTGGELLTLAVFASGCALGLMVFSRVLRFLLVRHGPETMAVLCGFMIGSLKKVWPFQPAVEGGDAYLPDSFDEFVAACLAYLPDSFDGHVAACLAIGAACFALVIAADMLARRRAAVASSAEPLPAPDGTR